MPEALASQLPLDLTVRGRRMGVDVGTVRVGVALTDPDAILATPLTTLDRDLKKHFDVKIAAKLVREHSVVEVAVGLPLSMAGEHTASTEAAVDWAERLARRLATQEPPVPVRLVDERWTSVQSHRQLLEAGVSRREHRDKVDQQAAVTILESALQTARRAMERAEPADGRGTDKNTDTKADESALSANSEGDLT